MRRLYIALVLLLALALGATLVPSPATAQDGGGTVQHVVRAGDTLYSIARQYNVTVDAIVQANSIPNPSVIYLGQVLVIPTSSSATPPPATVLTTTPTATPVAGQEVIHTVQPGENLYRIALRYGTTVQAIMALNNLADPNVIYVNQRLRVAVGETPTPATTAAVPVVTADGTAETATSTPTAQVTTEAAVATESATPSTPVDSGPAPTVPFSFGIHVELVGQDATAVADHVSTLGMTWVKQEIDWSMVEPTRGQIDFAMLDSAVQALESTGADILLTVTNAPDWARATTQDDGPPANYADYASFVGTLAGRYAGRVDAYEIWSEPNLRQNWAGKPISGAEYVNLLRGA